MVYSVELNAPKSLKDTILIFKMLVEAITVSYEFLDKMKICASLPKMNDDHCLNQLKDLERYARTTWADARESCASITVNAITITRNIDFPQGLIPSGRKPLLKRNSILSKDLNK
ncbi:hypothetical protein NPIL_266531 [Nephila pilipes]|uniref:Uncharacterized protein n=1 Tax=Nephila pilipes TaxID=299642 RepID=A0A8X6PKI7_NEPPI|nr:hypothetical protein NPIL_266531 [Nephila pilipes]